MSSDGSPSPWRKPADIMRLRRKRKSSSNTPLRSPSEISPQPSPNTPTEPVSPSWKRPGQKRRNPFGCSPRKRIHLSNRHPSEGSDDSGVLLNVLNGTDNTIKKEQKFQKKDDQQLQNIDSLLEASCNNEKTTEVSQEEEEPSSPEVCGETCCAIDWSLKTKARFVSPQPFSWCAPLRTTDESAGLAAFAQVVPDSVKDTVQHPSQCERSKREFQKHLLYWQHPNLPWLRLCPRIVPDNKIGKPGSWVMNDDIQAALLSDWTGSFMSAFNQLRGGRCPYFYLCAHAFTVLFRAGGVGGRPTFHAILSPTSRGLRESLKKEGIDFSMPLADSAAPKGEQIDKKEADLVKDEYVEEQRSKMEGEKPSAEQKDEDITATDDGATSFLEDLGLDTKRYRSLDPSKIKLQRESYRTIDHRPESVVVVDGGDTQALFNFLLNCRSCFASSGIQTGIPPTLIAPVPFKGANLQCLKYKTGSVRQQATAQGTTSLWHSLELEGVLLPHTIHGLTQLFSHTQHNFHATFSTHDASAPLNAALSIKDNNENTEGENEEAISGLQNTGIQESHIKNIVRDCTLGKMVVRDVSCQDGLFTCNI